MRLRSQELFNDIFTSVVRPWERRPQHATNQIDSTTTATEARIEIVCAQNPILSQNNREKKTTSTMVNKRQQLGMMEMTNQQSTKMDS